MGEFKNKLKVATLKTLLDTCLNENIAGSLYEVIGYPHHSRANLGWQIKRVCKLKAISNDLKFNLVAKSIFTSSTTVESTVHPQRQELGNDSFDTNCLRMGHE